MTNKYLKRIENLQNKAIRVLNFANLKAPSNPLYKESNILKFTDNIKLLNFMYVYDCTRNEVPSVLQNNFTPISNIHTYNTRSAIQNQMSVPKVNTQIYGVQSINFQSVKLWNFMVCKFSEKNLQLQSKSFCKKIRRDYFLESYKLNI